MINNKFRPMLCAPSRNEDLSELRFPLLCSPKIDGIRCCMIAGKAKSRSLKPIPNRYIQRTLNGLPPFDGELAVGTNFQDCTSGIMTHEGRPDFTYYVFDQIPLLQNTPFSSRIKWLEAWERDHPTQKETGHVKILPQVEVCNLRELNALLKLWLRKGYEGLVARTVDSPYKYGRPTWKEGYVVKFKPFEDAEAEIVGFVEEFENKNKKKKNELGLSHRSSHQANFKGKNTLGAFIVNTKKWGRFRVGTGDGLGKKLRKRIWKGRGAYLGRIIKFRYQLHGTKNKPRIPVFLGFRDKRDL